jgi:hypothetical protein
MLTESLLPGLKGYFEKWALLASLRLSYRGMLVERKFEPTEIIVSSISYAYDVDGTTSPIATYLLGKKRIEI